MLQLAGQYLPDVVDRLTIVILGPGGSRTFSHTLQVAQGFSTTEATYLMNALALVVNPENETIPQNPLHKQPGIFLLDMYVRAGAIE